MDLNQAGAAGEMPGRQESFSQGSSGNPYRVASTMDENSVRYNDMVGKDFTPTSVLNQTVLSGNGMSQNDYSTRVLSNGTELPTGNGEDPQTRQGIARLLLDGMRQVGTL